MHKYLFIVFTRRYIIVRCIKPSAVTKNKSIPHSLSSSMSSTEAHGGWVSTEVGVKQLEM